MPIRRLDDFADTCVFTKQSLGPILCGRFRLPCARQDHLPPAPLLPKLRGHFAEFLNQDSLERLRLLASPTCVGLRYGHTYSSFTKLFLAVRLRSLSEVRRLLRHRISASPGGFAYPETPTSLHRSCPLKRRTFHLCVPPRTQAQYRVVREC